jgi:hypothetical protein
MMLTAAVELAKGDSDAAGADIRESGAEVT